MFPLHEQVIISEETRGKHCFYNHLNHIDSTKYEIAHKDGQRQEEQQNWRDVSLLASFSTNCAYMRDQARDGRPDKNRRIPLIYLLCSGPPHPDQSVSLRYLRVPKSKPLLVCDLTSQNPKYFSTLQIEIFSQQTVHPSLPF